MVVQAVDRRVFERFVARFPLKFKDSREDFGNNVFLRDVSAQGARITAKEPLLLNHQVDLLVELPDGRDPAALNGRIVWSKPIQANAWDGGIRFDKIDLMQTRRIFQYCQ